MSILSIYPTCNVTLETGVFIVKINRSLYGIKKTGAFMVKINRSMYGTNKLDANLTEMYEGAA
jgi:hypothetical protein